MHPIFSEAPHARQAKLTAQRVHFHCKRMIHQLAIDSGKKIETGVFGADMKVELLNDGPVTIVMDSKSKE